MRHYMDFFRILSFAPGLVYSALQYCTPVWLNGPNTNRIDTEFNNTMRFITGHLRSIPPSHELSVLSHFPPLHLNRLHSLTNNNNKKTRIRLSPKEVKKPEDSTFTIENLKIGRERKWDKL